MRHLREQPPSGSAGSSRKKPYYLQEYMTFLIPFLRSKKQSSNLDKRPLLQNASDQMLQTTVGNEKEMLQTTASFNLDTSQDLNESGELETSANSFDISDSSYIEEDNAYLAAEEEIQTNNDHDYFNPLHIDEVIEIDNGVKDDEVTEIDNGVKESRKRKKGTSLEDVAMEYFGKRAQQTDSDGMMSFFKSLLPDIQNFSVAKKRLLKLKILNVINELSEE